MKSFEKLPDRIRPLTEFEIVPFSQEQLDKFTYESIHAQAVMNFDPGEALENLRSNEVQNEPVFAVDIGGDTVAAGLSWLSGDRLVFDGHYQRVQKSSNGVGYLALLEEVSMFAQQNQFPVGISYAGPIEGSQPVDGPNVKTFLEELDQKYDGDFANLFPTLTAVRNDAVAGLISGAIQAKKERQGTTNVVYLINGSGVGGAVLAGLGNEVFATEPGHVGVVPDLNIENQQKACGQFGESYACIENVAASKAGIEDIWFQLTGMRLGGKELEDLYLGGNRTVANLYDDSAIVVAHAIQGMSNVFGFDLKSKATVIVGHGGAFKFPYYGDRVQQVIGHNLGAQPRLIMTKDYSPNACLDGAAMSALLTIAR